MENEIKVNRSEAVAFIIGFAHGCESTVKSGVELLDTLGLNGNARMELSMLNALMRSSRAIRVAKEHGVL
jgi:hypothetical protein